MPEIAARTISENDFPSEVNSRIETLISEIRSGTVRPIVDPGTEDAEGWNDALKPYLGLDWLQIPWFVAETYMYRRIVEATGYFQPGPTYHVDPYSFQKQSGLEQSIPGITQLWSRVDGWVSDRQFLPDHLVSLFLADLWGNQADLSVFPAGKDEQPAPRASHDSGEHLLVNEAPQVVEALYSRSPVQRIDMILDNAGFELCGDLALAYFLLEAGLANTIRLHVKLHPTFVSDTIATDITTTLSELEGRTETGRVSSGVRVLLDENRLQIVSDPFWTSPLPVWKMPEGLKTGLSRSSLVIFKGDANYRRLLGDLHWPFDTSFTEIVRYFPAPLVALRAMKSEIVSGLAPGQANDLLARDPEWQVNGRWGLIQYAP